MRKSFWFFIIGLGVGIYYLLGVNSNVLKQSLEYLTRNLNNLYKSNTSTHNNTTTEVFKYQDQKGQWHFSNKPFDDQSSVGTTTYRSDTNIVPPVTTSAPVNSKKTAPSANASPSPLTVYTNPEIVRKLIDDAQQLQGKLTDRKVEMDKTIDAQ